MARTDHATPSFDQDSRAPAAAAEDWRGRRACANGDTPLVTIVTATMNAAAALPYTIRSLRTQVGASFEWLVVDGGSTDGTLDLLPACDAFTSWISEPDDGIYDAWNKACRGARGDWVLFLGAGDELAAPDVVAQMSRSLGTAHPCFDVVYGRVQNISDVGRQVLEEIGEPWEHVHARWEIGRPALPPHSGVFHHRSLLTGAGPFDTRFQLAGDAHLLLQHLTRKPPLFVPIIVNRAPVGGVSMQLGNVMLLHREIREINRLLGLVPPFWHSVADRILLSAKVAASLLPVRMGHVVADMYRVMAGKPRRWSVR